MRDGSISSDVVPVDVHPDLDDAHELHEIDHRLSMGIAGGDCPRPTAGGLAAFCVRDDVVTVLVDAAARVGDGQGRTILHVDLERAERSEPLPHVVDADRGDAIGGQLGCEVAGREMLVAARAAADEGDRPAGFGPRAGRQIQCEVDIVVALHERGPGSRSDGRDVFARVNVVVG